MKNEGCSSSFIVSLLIVAMALWLICLILADKWDVSPVVIFVSLIILGGILFYFIRAITLYFDKKQNEKYNEIIKKYPKAFEKYLTTEGLSDPSKVPTSFKHRVIKRQELMWKNEELVIIGEEEVKVKRQLKEIEAWYPNGLKIWKERNPMWSIDYLVRNKGTISIIEEEYQAKERKRIVAEQEAEARRKDEELITKRKKEEDRKRLESSAKEVLTISVRKWKKMTLDYFSLDFHYTWLFYYYPKTCVFQFNDEEKHNRRIIWHFKNDPDRRIAPFEHDNAMNEVIPMIKQRLIDTFGAEYLPFLTLVCLPASTSTKNQARYEDFSIRLCNATGMENAYSNIHIIQDGMSKNDPRNTTGQSIQPQVSFDDCFGGKYVLLFDDVITKGGTMLRYKSLMEKMGATVIGGLTLGKTKHERPEQQGSGHIIGEDEIRKILF